MDRSSRRPEQAMKRLRLSRHGLSWFCATLVCLLAAVPGACGEDEPENEELRKSLVAAYEKTVAIHCAWTVASASDPEDGGDVEDAPESREVELYREGKFMGILCWIGKEEPIALVANGAVMVLSGSTEEDPVEIIAPGPRWLHRSYRAWVAATDFLNELLGTRLSRPLTYRTYFDFVLEEETLNVSLSTSGGEGEQAGWLEPDHFQGDATTTQELVTIKKNYVSIAYRRSDGTIQSVARDEGDGSQRDLLEPALTRRSPAEWKKLITRLCGAALVKPGDGYDANFQYAWCASHLGMFLEDDRKLLQHPNRLRSVVTTLLSVLYSSDRLNAWLTLGAMEEHADREKATVDAATVLYRELWKHTQSELEESEPPFSKEESEQLSTLLWVETFKRTQAVFAQHSGGDEEAPEK